ncbi:hypothetical protein QJQ45_013709, partial [Haematococcus lacustris]
VIEACLGIEHITHAQQLGDHQSAQLGVLLAAGATAWDTFLYVFEGPPATCSANPGTSAELTNDDDSSSCGELQSRVNFTALPGTTYYVPPPPPPRPPPPPLPLGHCGNPVVLSLLVAGTSNLVVGAGMTTVGATDSMITRFGRDVSYAIAGDVAYARNITIDTCVPGATAWDTFLYVFEGPPVDCIVNPGRSWGLTNDDDSSSCGELQSRVNFIALPGITYYV